LGRHGKGISSGSKIEAVEKYLQGQGSLDSIAREYGIDGSTFLDWITKYEVWGPTGLITTHTNNHYPAELKTAAVEAYLRGEGSLKDICKKFRIRNKRQLRDWIALYNKGHINPRAGAGQRRRIPMTKGRKTMLDERVEIVSFCIANGKDTASPLRSTAYRISKFTVGCANMRNTASMDSWTSVEKASRWKP